MNTCQSCNNKFQGKFCNKCGEKVLEKSDLSLFKILGDFLQALTFANSKVVKSIWYLLAKPGKLSSEFIQGRRVGYMRPIALFFIINILYFIGGKLSDYTPDLNHQYYYTPYREYVQPKIDKKQESLGLEDQFFMPLYDSKSQYYAKSLAIINVPVIALLYFILLFKKRKYYTEHLIHAFHFFAFILLAITIIPHVVGFLIDLFGIDVPSEKPLQFILLSTLAIYSFFSLKQFYELKWYWSVPVTILTFPIVFAAMTVFKFILLHITLYSL